MHFFTFFLVSYILSYNLLLLNPSHFFTFFLIRLPIPPLFALSLSTSPPPPPSGALAAHRRSTGDRYFPNPPTHLRIGDRIGEWERVVEVGVVGRGGDLEMDGLGVLRHMEERDSWVGKNKGREGMRDRRASFSSFGHTANSTQSRTVNYINHKNIIRNDISNNFTNVNSYKNNQNTADSNNNDDLSPKSDISAHTNINSNGSNNSNGNSNNRKNDNNYNNSNNKNYENIVQRNIKSVVQSRLAVNDTKRLAASDSSNDILIAGEI